MSTSRRLINSFIAVVFLVGCSSVNPTSDPSLITPRLANPAPTVNDFETPTPVKNGSLSTWTPKPTVDLSATYDAFAQEMSSTMTAKEILVAKYPHLCGPNHFLPELSPNGLWLVESCLSEDDGDVIFTISNRENQVLWKLILKDYLPVGASDAYLSIVHWSNDGRYVYFYSFLNGSGGECYVLNTNGGLGVFRMDLQNGDTTTVLPVQNNYYGYDNFYLWYTFSFSPTDRRLVYGVQGTDLRILDLTTGHLISIGHKDAFYESGGYIWSQDGLSLVYSTALYTRVGDTVDVSYTLRLADVQTGNEQILLESPRNCFTAISWAENNILTLTRNYNEALIEFDLSSNTIISETTTP